ncbi:MULTISPECIES: TetR/AcrR family transcriptional regulator [unclassified Thioalkalivibrio]|uniref:TetR/AcrR family transcriptional regulator n=1 Tax=unclassified Thioalkalivibrio TaxID=2621013 RepID=UPI00036AAD49|nr:MULTISPECIES: TetR/AcrR family transcriptional regulator [unclassified Thioalkalivibrio]
MSTVVNKKLRGEVLRQRVLETALELFSTCGYFNTSIHDIRREADVSIGSIYHHFGNKEALAKALYDELLERMDAGLREVMERERGCRARCDGIIAFMFRAATDDPRTMRFVLESRHREFLPDEPPVCSSRPFMRMRECIEQGIASGEVCPIEVPVAATAAFGGAIRLLHLHLDGVLEKPLSRYLASMQDAAWRAIASDPPAPAKHLTKETEE